MKKVTKAVIAAAGLATRFLPVTKIIPKPLIPVLNKPVIQYIVEELLSANITHIIFVVPEQSRILEDYFKPNRFLVNELNTRGKTQHAELVNQTDAAFKITFLKQSPLGNGAPIIRAESHLKGEPFLFAFADDLVLSKDSFSKELIEVYEKYNTPVIGVDTASVEQIMACGAVNLKPGTDEVSELTEKPTREEVRTNLLEFGRMVLTSDIIEVLKKTKKGKGGELWLMDALSDYIKGGGKIHAVKIEDGKWYTTGDPINHLRASIAYGLKNPDLREKIKKVLEEFTN